MNFSGISLHSPEIGVCQPKVYGDIQSHHNMSWEISYQLGNINTTGRARWHIAQKEWKIDNVEIKIITFVIEFGVKSIVAPYNGPGNLLGHQMCCLFQQLVGRGKSL